MKFDRMETRSLNPDMNDEDNIFLILLYCYLFDNKLSFQNERIRESAILLTVVFLEGQGERVYLQNKFREQNTRTRIILQSGSDLHIFHRT
jgi:hypothetical protein